MDDVRIGIVGLGNMGTLTADFIYAGDVEHCVIGAICDIREERILYAKKHFTHLSEDCFYKDFRKMIAEAMIDAVYTALFASAGCDGSVCTWLACDYRKAGSRLYRSGAANE